VKESLQFSDMLDDLDRAILRELQQEGRITNAELSRRVNLSQPAVLNRVNRLEERGFIQRYVALLDREMLGYDLLCFIEISMQAHSIEQLTGFRDRILTLPQVLECHHVTGSYDYLLKIVSRNRKELQRFVVDNLTTIPGVDRIQTSLVFAEIKSSTAYEIE
jgi:Lrp/AsnC family transcriptional regulator, leucine-responsive regulatory protein